MTCLHRSRVRLATAWPERLRGLLGRETFEGVLMLSPCHDIHTWGMRRPIDVAFIDAAGTVLWARRAVSPRERLRCRGARAVLERYSDETDWFEAGDEAALVRVEGDRL